MIKLLLTIGLGFHLLFTLDASAERREASSQNACIAQIEALRNDRAANPLEALEALDPLVGLSQDRAWQTAHLYALTYRLELYVKQENVSGAAELYGELLPLVTESNLQPLVTRLMMANLKIKFALSDTENIAELYGPLKQRAEQSKDSAEKGEIYLSLGLSQQSNMRLGDATKSYKLAYEFFESVGDQVSKALVLNSLADTYNVLGDTNLAAEYFKLALDLHKTANDEFGQSVVLYNLGRLYLTTAELELAQASFTSALEISEEIGDTIGVAWARSALAKLAIKSERWDDALNFLGQAEVTFGRVGDKQSQLDCILNEARAYLGAGEIEKAEQKLALSKTLLPPVRTAVSYFQFSEVDIEIGLAKNNYKRAYGSLQEKYKWAVEQHKRDKAKQVQRCKTEFDTQLKEKQNEVLQKENELKQLQIIEQQREQKFWMLSIVWAIVLLLFVAMLLFIQTKNRNRFKALALRDHLTNSPNRRAILQYAEDCFNDAVHSGASFLVGIVDLDSFKKLNDSFGHDAGDEVLKNFASACSTVLRQQDGYGRYGGEEWLVVFSRTEIAQVEIIFERLRSHLNELPAKGIPNNHTVTFSMGIACYDSAKHKNLDALIKCADQKLYWAKDNGRNRLAA